MATAHPLEEGKPTTFLGALHFNQEVSAELGALMGEFSIMEFLLVKMLARLIGEQAEAILSHQILGQIQSVSLRISIVKGCASKASLTPDERAAYLEAISLIKTINEMRNQYVHAVYETNTESFEVTRTVWGTSTTRSISHSVVTKDSIQTDRLKIIEMHGEILKSLFNDDIHKISSSSS